MHDPPPETDGSTPARPPAGDSAPPVQYCPWCGEHVGSFWGRRDDDGGHWCETCQRFFRVEAL